MVDENPDDRGGCAGEREAQLRISDGRGSDEVRGAPGSKGRQAVVRDVECLYVPGVALLQTVRKMLHDGHEDD